MRILQVVHGYPPSGAGGTEIYVRDLAVAQARAGDDVVVVTREADPRRPELDVRASIEDGVTVVRINNTFQSCTSFEDSYTGPGVRAIVAAILDDREPDVVHVQHLTCLSTGILEDAAARGIPLVMTLNDYWMICHRGQLLDLDGNRCAGPQGAGCARCIQPAVLAGRATYRAGRWARSLPVPGAAAAARAAGAVIGAAIPHADTRNATLARLRHMQSAAAHVKRFFAPSRTIAEQFRSFGIPEDRTVRCEQGIDLAPFEQVERRPASQLRVGFAGSLIPSKAPHVLLEAVAGLPRGTVSVDLLGSPSAYHGDTSYADALAPLVSHPSVRRLGPVPHSRMAAALAAVDVLVVPSVWIENAPFIIREAFAARAVVIASDVGGMAEMVRHDADGLLFPPGDIVALRSLLAALARDRDVLERLRSGIRRPMSMDEDAAGLRTHYTALGGADRPTRRPQPRTARGRTRVAAVVLNFRTPEQTWLAVRSLQTSFSPPASIVVVDNGSADGSSAWLRGALPGVEVVDTGANLGFSGGCNVGITRALASGAEAVLLVNSDAVLAPGAIDHLVEAAERDERAGVVAPVLVSREEPDHIASAGISFSRRSGRMRHRAAGHRVSSLEPGTARTVDAVSGCVMLIKREVFERVGLLDVAYFFSFEDIDFCLRARAAGWHTICAQRAVAYHEGGRSIGRRSPRRVYFATRNHLRLAATSGSRRFHVPRAAAVVGLNVAYVLVAPEAPLVRGLAAVARGTWHHALGRYGAG